jgi:gliding motility-associated-like protein
VVKSEHDDFSLVPCETCNLIIMKSMPKNLLTQYNFKMKTKQNNRRMSVLSTKGHASIKCRGKLLPYWRGFLFILALLPTMVSAQDDVGVTIINSPQSGCQLGNESVQVEVFNYGASLGFATFNVTYVIDGITTTSQSQVFTSFNTNETRTVSFTLPADLSVAGPHTLDIFTELGSDVDNTNDTLSTIVINDAPSDGGTLLSDDTVCQGTSDTLVLSGTIGQVVGWEYSDDGGGSWVNLSNTDTFLIYSNAQQTRQYRASVQNGTCANDYSSIAVITVDQAPNAGTLGSSSVVCASVNGDLLQLSAYVGTIDKWQIDDGGGWIDSANTTDTMSYSNLTQTTEYRVIVTNGVCPADTSNIVTITVISASVGGTLLSDDTVCEGTSDTLVLSGTIGQVVGWEYSDDGGGSWVNLSNTDTFLIYSNAQQTRQYRALVQNGTCASAYSSIAVITVDQAPSAGTLGSSSVVCASVNGDLLQLSAYVGTIDKWQIDDGGGWIDSANTTDTMSYSNLTQTTEYRVIVTNGVCPADTSNIVTITVVSASVGGTLLSDDTVCEGTSDTLVLSGTVGQVVGWEYSDDGGGTWVNLSNTDTFLIYSNAQQTRQYRALVQNGTCANAYSSIAVITVDQAANAGTLGSSSVVCASGNGDLLQLSAYIGTIDKWQIDDGGGWIDSANTTDTMSYSNLTQTTEYKVIVTNGVCPADTSNIVTMTVVSGSVGGVIVSSDSVCEGSNGDTLNLAAYSGNVIQWELSTDGGSTWIPIVNTTDQQPYSNVSQTTMYRTLVEASGCSAVYSDTATITAIPPAIGGFVLEDKSICGGTNTDTLYLMGYLGDIVKWQFDNGTGWTDIANTSDTLIVNNITLTTSYRAIVTNTTCPNDTSDMATLTVIATTIGGNILSSDSVCAGSNANTLDLLGHVGDIRWWEQSSDNGVTWSPIANIGTQQGYVDLSQTTWYRVLVEGTSCPSEYSDTAIITTYTPTVSIAANGPTEFCDGDSVELDATSGFVTYAWSSGATTESTVAFADGFMNVTITDSRGCVDMDSILITVYNLPVAEAGEEQTISLGETVALNGTGGISYFWEPGETLNDATLATPSATPEEDTQYMLTVTDENGCQDADSVTIFVSKDYLFKPNNTITPNGDGFNDTWIIDNIHAYPEATVMIMNRYGELVFEQQAYDNSWDGSSNGTQLSDGTYYYVILSDGTEIIYKGHLTILSK